MKPAVLNNPFYFSAFISSKYSAYLFAFFSGLLGPLGFAPFHLPGMAIISMVSFYHLLRHHSVKRVSFLGFFYGLGYFGLGVSWVIISIHDYGNLNYFLSGLTTLGFIFYLSLYPMLVSYSFKRLALDHAPLGNALLFSALWCLSEFLRANLFTGFPWLLIGTTQIDTPMHSFFPIVGVYGVSLLSVFACTLLAEAIREESLKRYCYIISFVFILITPALFKNAHWTELKKEPISVGVVQANLAMRDKWDDALFWNLLKYYEKNINTLLGKNLIILPESAIPLPASYLNEYLIKLHQKASAAHSALVLGILQATDDSESSFYNAVISLGKGKGTHRKNQLVPFGEYIPQPFEKLTQWLGIPPPNIAPGKRVQSLIKINKHPIASLICYEIAYPNLARQQMPLAEWIISISDNGWFGHSLASYQQLQMAQILSLVTGRYQVLANNDGLSSVINERGEIIDSLPPFSSGLLQSTIFASTGSTPWIIWSDYPALIFCLIILLFLFFLRLKAFQSH
ncbi:apolipoprotein N-acyltransferase [Legionella sp. km772]|uniref:apolipoprotein N-acyltransferase n=1 Tax=Legionella sp. km772 TaxID=2498111 RepID=UPI000F8E03B2|nr:apolipoprotein N-acyltransferase [Legionella sp. km772]RUR09596.1 apolipoprotein N-acyltransferase [Legionella sp. km772]